MLDALSYLVEFLGLIGNLIVSMVNSLFSFFSVLASAVSMPLTLMQYAPWPLATCVMCVVSIATVKLIVGR